MNVGKTVFAQAMEQFSRYQLEKCIDRHRGHHRFSIFSCLDQFLCMAFAQLTGRESPRDIETCLNSPDISQLEPPIRPKPIVALSTPQFWTRNPHHIGRSSLIVCSESGL